MSARLDYGKVSPAGLKAMYALEHFIYACGLESSLIEFVKLRASQLNGCAYCIDMHTLDARAEGETEQRLHLLSVWREAGMYTEREQAALEWTEALTLVAETHAPDEVYERVRKHFSEEELVNLTYVIVTINGWNRLAIGFRSEPGHYQPKAKTS